MWNLANKKLNNYYASPVLDSDGFWITSILPSNSLGLKDVLGKKRAATAEFTLPYRLSSHTMEVEVVDTVGNQEWEQLWLNKAQFNIIF